MDKRKELTRKLKNIIVLNKKLYFYCFITVNTIIHFNSPFQILKVDSFVIKLTLETYAVPIRSRVK